MVKHRGESRAECARTRKAFRLYVVVGTPDAEKLTRFIVTTFPHISLLSPSSGAPVVVVNHHQLLCSQQHNIIIFWDTFPSSQNGSAAVVDVRNENYRAKTKYYSSYGAPGINFVCEYSSPVIFILIASHLI